MIFSHAFCLLLSWTSVAAALDLYPHYEKPSLTKPSANLPSLYLAKGEWWGFSVRMKGAKAQPLQGLKYTVKKGPSLEPSAFYLAGHRPGKNSFSSKPVRFVEDIVIPNEWLSEKGFHFPLSNQDLQGTSFLIEFQIPKSAEAGDFQGLIEFMYLEKKYEIPVAGKISKMSLPENYALKTSFGFSPSAVIMRHAPQWNAHSLQIYRQYVEQALDHHIDLHKIYLEFPKLGGSDLLASSQNPAQSFRKLWNEFSAYSPAMQTTDIPVPEEMKYVDAKNADLQKMEKYWKALDAAVVQSKSEKSFFVYFVDEPQPKQMASIEKSLKQIQKWAPHLKFLITTPYKEELKNLVQIWCENLFLWGKPDFKSPEFYEKLPGETWFYTGCNAHGCDGAEDHMNPDMVTDRVSAYHLAFPWMAFRYKAKGILYFDTVYGYGKKDPSPWKDGFSFTGLGEGNLFYPCTEKICGKEAPVLSLRMKIMRKGLQDVEILRMAAQQNLSTLAWVKELIPSVTDFPLEARAYEAIKVKALREWDK